jgi:H/ACA ribonucleoprotein complex subunit 3
MSIHILKCLQCGTYTIKDKCPKCSSIPVQPIPAKYSPEDQYGKYRRETKKQQMVEKGWL